METGTTEKTTGKDSCCHSNRCIVNVITAPLFSFCLSLLLFVSLFRWGGGGDCKKQISSNSKEEGCAKGGSYSYIFYSVPKYQLFFFL